MSDIGEVYEYYGVIIPDRRFHISPQCPYLRTMHKWKEGDLTGYSKETDAILMGHIKRCPVCFGMYRFRIKVGENVSEFLLDKHDLEVLDGMATLHRKRESISITTISESKAMSFTQVNDIVKRLRKLGLVAGAEWTAGVQQRGKRKFTMLGMLVLSAYAAKIYGPPMSESMQPPEKANTRIV